MRSDRRRLLILLALLPAATPAFSQDWQALDDAGITAALSARVLQYPDGATQNFFSDGRTLYEVSTGSSWGVWWVEGGQYCSTWPPSATPACFGVERNGLDVRFTDSRGEVTVGRQVDL